MKPTKLFLALAVAVLLGACGNTITAQKMEYASSQMVELPQKGQFVLKGRIENVNPENPGKISLAVCDVWENELHDILIQSDGTFTKVIPIREIQDVYLYIGDTFTLTVCDDDTISLTMDKNRWEETLDISGHTLERDRELKLSVELYRKLNAREQALNNAIRKTSRDLKLSVTDSTLMRQLVEYVNDYARIVEEWEHTYGLLPHKDAFLVRAFFGQLYFLARNDEALTSLQYGWELQNAVKSIAADKPLIQTLRPQWLIHNTYRKFIASYCEGVQTQAVISFNGNVSSNNGSFILRAKVGELVIPDKTIREYALVDHLEMQIRMLGYDNILPYVSYLDSTVTTPWIKEQLQAIKQENTTWAEGKQTPEFDFIDENGKHYTLTDFKGRFVYLDIWGVGCGPCYREFENISALHEKYKTHEGRIAYVYLCGSYSNKEAWLRTAKRYGLAGYNLALPENYKGAYDIGVFPTYILIDPDGNVIEYNTSRPSELLKEDNNILDRILKTENGTDNYSR